MSRVGVMTTELCWGERDIERASADHDHVVPDIGEHVGCLPEQPGRR